MTDTNIAHLELNTPPQPGEALIEYVATHVQPALDDFPDRRRTAQFLIDAITEDVEHGQLVGMTPKFVSETKDDSAEIPISTFVKTFAEGHYPLAAPGDERHFGHDVRDHFTKGYRKFGKDRALSDHIQSQAQVLVDELRRSGLELDDPANVALKERFEAFGNNIDKYTAFSANRIYKLHEIYA